MELVSEARLTAMLASATADVIDETDVLVSGVARDPQVEEEIRTTRIGWLGFALEMGHVIEAQKVGLESHILNRAGSLAERISVAERAMVRHQDNPKRTAILERERVELYARRTALLAATGVIDAELESGFPYKDWCQPVVLNIREHNDMTAAFFGIDTPINEDGSLGEVIPVSSGYGTDGWVGPATQGHG